MPIFPFQSPAEIAHDDGPSFLRSRLSAAAALVDSHPYVPLDRDEHQAWQIGYRAAVLVAAIVLVFSGTVLGGWLWLDDATILNNAQLRSLNGLISIWKNPWSIPGPAAMTFQWAEYHLFLKSAVGYRATSLAIHATSAVVLWLILRRLGVRGAWLAAAIVAMHPGNMMTVAWISRQSDLLFMLCELTAIWAFLRCNTIEPTPPEERFEDSLPVPYWTWGFLVFATLAGLLVNAAGAWFAPAVCLVIAAGWGARVSRLQHIGFGLVVLLSVGEISYLYACGAFVMSSKLLNVAAGFVWVPFKTFFPIDLPPLYDRSFFTEHVTLFALAAIGLFAGCAAYIAQNRSRAPIRAAGAALLLLSFAMCFFQVGQSERNVTLAVEVAPYFSSAVLIACIVSAVLSRSDALSLSLNRATRGAGGAVMLIVCGFAIVHRAGAYSDLEHFWKSTIEKDRSSVIGCVKLAEVYVADGMTEESASLLEAVAESRRDASWYTARAHVYQAANESAKSVTMLSRAAQLDPSNDELAMLLADAQMSTGQVEDAAKIYERLATRHPTDTAALNNLGLANQRLGRPLTAATMFRKAIDVDPNFVAAHLNLANALFELKRPQEAAQELQQVVAIDSHNYPAFLNAGVMLYHMKDYARAEQMLRAAVHLNSTSADAYNDLGIVLAAQNKTSEAAWALTQATQIDPQNTSARENFAALRRQISSTTKPN